MTCCSQRLTNAGETGARRIFGECQRGQTMRMSGILASLMKFALQILLGDFHIAQMFCSTFCRAFLAWRHGDSRYKPGGKVIGAVPVS